MLKHNIKIAFISSKRPLVPVIASLMLILLCIPVIIPTQEKVPLYSITREELRDQIFFLASDELEGRDTGSEGFAIAALYAVTQFKMSGLEPLIVGKDGKKTFFQSVPFSSYDTSNKSTFTISSSTGETILFHADKMVLFRNPSVGKNIFVDENPVFIGYGIDDPEIGWSDYDDVDVRGKVVFLVGGAPSKDGKPVFPPEKDSFYRDFGLSANARIVTAMKHGVSALVFVPDPQMAKNWSNISSSMNRRQFTLLLEDNKKVDSPALFGMHPDAVTEMLKNAGYDWTYGDHDYKPAVLENIKVSCSIEKDNEKEITCKNIVSLLPGTDPQLKEEYIVLHAHLDHLGINSNGQVMNGADDNASGCAVVLEVAEALAIKPPKRSFIFVLFTGEEKGTLGSEWFVSHLPVPQEKIVLNATVDMIGRKSRRRPDVIYVTAEGKDKENLFDIAKRANQSLIQADIDFSLNEKDPDGHIMRCDTRPFLDKNITSLLFTRGFMGPVYHHPRDDAETLNYDKILKASRLLYLVLSEAGNLTNTHL
ncbi:MAG: M28 family peptidase [Candidatus Aminicenantes bacterium]|nr:MAG: M28 family peptidase [Candidatus Aminicenantes bacterium]